MMHDPPSGRPPGLTPGSPQGTADLGRKGVVAVLWGTGSTIGQFVLQLGAQVLLARILGPEAFGIFGLGFVVFTLTGLVGSFGFGWALMQLEEIGEDDIRFAFTWQALSGGLAAAALYLAAGRLALFFGEPSLEAVLHWLALACVLDAMTGTSTNLLRRRMDFRTIGLIGVSSYAVGYLAVGIPAALAGAGVFALVAAWLVQTGVKLAATYAAARHSLRPVLWHGRARTIFDLGGTVFVTNVLNWVLANVDRILIGRLIDAVAVGLYTVSYNLARRPNQLFLSSVQPVFFAAGAQIQQDPNRLRAVYLQVLAAICVFVVPFFVFLAVVAPDLIDLLYGPDWSPAGGILAILCLGMPFWVALALTTPVLWNTGRKHLEPLLQLPLLPVLGAAFYLAARRGVLAVALVATLLFAMRFLLIGIAAFRALNLRFVTIRPYVVKSVGLSILTVGAATVGRAIPSGVGGDWLPLLAASSTTVVTLGALVGFRPKILGPETIRMIGRFLPSVETWIRRKTGS